MQFRQSKEQMPLWMVVTKAVSTRFPSALWRLSGKDSRCLPFKIAAGVHPVIQQKIHSTNMAGAALAQMMVKEELGQTTFTYLVRLMYNYSVKRNQDVVQLTPDYWNLQGKSKKVRVIEDVAAVK